MVAAALDVRKTPSNRGTRQHLDSLRREWAGKVQELTGAIDDVIDPEDFMAVSGEGVMVCVCGEGVRMCGEGVTGAAGCEGVRV